MARVYNQVITVTLSGDMRVKQYSGGGPLVVKLSGDREVSVSSGEYVIYSGQTAVGLVSGDVLDALRSDKDSLDTPEKPTGADIEVTVKDGTTGNANVLPNEPVFLKQDDVPIATGITDSDGKVAFNVLPGSYKVGPQDSSHGPDVEVTAVPAAPKAAGSSGAGAGTSGGSTQRFDVMGNPDPNGKYDASGQLLPA